MSGIVVPAEASTRQRHSRFGTYETKNRSSTEPQTASASISPQHEQEEASPSCWEELRRRVEVAADKNFDDFVNANADEDTDTTEVLDDEEKAQLVSGAQKESEDANDPNTVEALVPTPSRVIGRPPPSEVVFWGTRRWRGRFDFSDKLRELCASAAREAHAGENRELFD
ncbi:hypothetical protein MTO96_017846 [Rhipicephalus appendiculatus]